MKSFSILACLISLVLASIPSAAAEGELYLGGYVGALLLDEAENMSQSGSFNIDFEPGLQGGALLGYRLGERLSWIGTGRVEMEIGYRQSGLKAIDLAQGKVSAGGDLSALSFMLNTIAEYREAPSPWVPYIGVGVGYAIVTLKEATAGGGSLADDEDRVFAYQLGLGMGYEINRHLTLDLAYRYFSALNPRFTDATGENFESEFSAHSLLGGFRVRY